MTGRGAVRSHWWARGQASVGTRCEIRMTGGHSGEMRTKDQALCRHRRPQQGKVEDNSQTKQTSEIYISDNIHSPGHPVKRVSNVAGRLWLQYLRKGHTPLEMSMMAPWGLESGLSGARGSLTL